MSDKRARVGFDLHRAGCYRRCKFFRKSCLTRGHLRRGQLSSFSDPRGLNIDPTDQRSGLSVATPNALEPWPDQRTPALAIVARGDQIVELAPQEYRVTSQSRPQVNYEVHLRGERWSCTCAFFHAWKKPCVHIYAVRLRHGFKPDGAGRGAPPECTDCRSIDVVGWGYRATRAGASPRFLCRACGHRFTDREGFLRRRSDPAKIAIALDLYFRGLSVRKVSEHLAQVHDLKVSPSTVHTWIVTYSKLAARWMDSLAPRTGARWQIDETFVRGSGRLWYVWNVLDAESRFLLASHISRRRGLYDAEASIAKAKRATMDRPTEVLTDGFPAYPTAVGRQLGARVRGGRTNPHRRVRSIRAKVSNNRVERLNGTEKERLKVMRGLPGGRKSAAILEGFRVHYNLVQDHDTLGTTPGVAAGLPDPGKFRWKGILREATRAPVRRRGEGPVELVFITPG